MRWLGASLPVRSLQGSQFLMFGWVQNKLRPLLPPAQGCVKHRKFRKDEKTGGDDSIKTDPTKPNSLLAKAEVKISRFPLLCRYAVTSPPKEEN